MEWGDFMKDKIVKVLSVLLAVSALSISAYAHPGGTDSNGGHYNRATGEYHYHHGMSAHQHYDMDNDGDLDCPYDYSGSSNGNHSSNAGNSSRSSEITEADLKKQYKDGYEKGFAKGEEAGYAKGVKETEAIWEEKVESAKNAAYKYSLLFGTPVLILFAVQFCQVKREQSEEKLRKEVARLEKELRKRPPAFNECKYIANTKKTISYNGAILAEPYMPLNVLKSFTRDKDGDLILEMMDGSEYCYYDFPKSLYREMKNFYNTAEFIDRHVKGKYKCEKIT